MNAAIPQREDGVETAGGLPSIPLRSIPAASPGPSSAAIPRLEGYQISHWLGEGGMGTVWRAWQLSTRREVALKLLNLEGIASEKAKRRFDREIELTGRLQHPNIARVYDSGVHHGIYFYAMELVEGVPLDTYVHQQKLDQSGILSLFLTIANAVQYAHQKGVIHRDLKPSNILVDQDGQPHVLDFGLAKTCQVNDAGSAVSLDGDLAGTPAFMSPEQAAGHAEQIDTRTDVYSLGVIFYLLLTGRSPHNLIGGRLDILRRIVEDDVIRPRNIVPRLDAELDALICKALAKDPDARYASGGELAQDIRNYLACKPLAARPPTLLYLVSRKVRKYKIPVAAALVTLSTLIGTGVYSAVRISHERDLAVIAAQKELVLRGEAELKLGDSLVAWGDALIAKSRFNEARSKYFQARDLFERRGVSPLSADLGLVEASTLSRLPLTEIRLNKSSIVGAAFNPGTHEILAASADGSLQTVSLFTGPGAESKTLRDAVFLGATFAVDGRTVLATCVSSGSDVAVRSLRLIDTRNQAVLSEMPLTGTCMNYAATPNLDFVACCIAEFETNAQPVIYLYQLKGSSQFQFLRRVEGHYACFTADGKELISADRDGSVTISDVRSGTILTRLNVKGAPLTSIGVAPNGKFLLVGYEDGTIAWCDIQNGALIRQIASHEAAVEVLKFSPDGTRMLSADAKGLILIWDTETHQCMGSFEGRPERVLDMQFSPDGRLIASLGEMGCAQIWPLSSLRVTTDVQFQSPPTCIDISSGGRMIAVGHQNGILSLVDAETGGILARCERRGVPIHSIVFLDGDQHVLAGDRDGQVHTWSLATGAVETHVLEARSVENHVDLSRYDGSALVTGTKGLRLWNVNGFGQAETLDTSAKVLAGFSGNGRIGFAADANGAVSFFQIGSGKISRFRDPDFVHVSAAALSYTGTLALLANHKGELAAVDVNSGRLAWRNASAHKSIRHIAFSDDSRFAMTGGSDGIAGLWDVNAGRELRTISGTGGPISRVAVSPNLVALLNDRNLRIVHLLRPARYRNLVQNQRVLTATTAAPNLRGLGELHYLFGNFGNSAELLNRAQSVEKNSRNVLAHSLLELGRHQEAEARFQSLLDEKPGSAVELYFKLCLESARPLASERK